MFTIMLFQQFLERESVRIFRGQGEAFLQGFFRKLEFLFRFFGGFRCGGLIKLDPGNRKIRFCRVVIRDLHKKRERVVPTAQFRHHDRQIHHIFRRVGREKICFSEKNFRVN